MARRLRMSTLVVLVVMLGVLLSPAYAQEAEAPDGAVVEAAEVSGIDLDRPGHEVKRRIARGIEAVDIGGGASSSISTRR